MKNNKQDDKEMWKSVQIEREKELKTTSELDNEVDNILKEKHQSFNSVKEMLDDIEEKEKNRTKFQIVKDFIEYDIITPIVDVFHPRYNWYRLQRLIHRITKGWDYRDLWSLDIAFADYMLKNYKRCISVNVIKAFEYMSDEDNYFEEDEIDYSNIDMKKYNKRVLEAEKIIKSGINEFIDIIKNEYFTYFSYNIVATWWIPRLRLFEKITHGWPSNSPGYRHIDYDSLSEEQQKECDNNALDTWKRIIYDKILYAFVLIKENKGNVYSETDLREIKKGLSYFKKYIRNLWD